MTTTKEALKPNATLKNLTILQKQLVLAKHVDVDQNQLKESLQAEEALKNRIEKVRVYELNNYRNK